MQSIKKQKSKHITGENHIARIRTKKVLKLSLFLDDVIICVLKIKNTQENYHN